MQRLQYAAWGPGELFAAGAAIAAGRVRSGPEAERVAARLGALSGVRSAYPVNAGRTAIWLALLAMRELAPEKRRVVVPAYLCPGVVDAVERAGLDWALADVLDDLNVDPAAIEALLDGRTLAVIVPHMYGCPARIVEIERLCRAAGVFMIDDAAQIAGVEHQGRVLGSFGDAGILSFAQSKTIVTGVRGSGGVLLVSNPALEPGVRARFAKLPEARGRLAQFANFLCNDLALPRLGAAGYYAARALQRLAPSRGNRDFFAPAQMSNLDAAIARRQMMRLPALRQARIRLGEQFAAELRGIEGVRFLQHAPGRYLTRFMVAVADGVDVAQLRSDLRRAGIETRQAYRALTLPGCRPPKAQEWSRRLVELPSRTTMGIGDVRAVCEALRQTLRARPPSAAVRLRPGAAQ